MNLLQETLPKITAASQEWRDKATARIETLTMPHWALGNVLDLAVDVAGITNSITPSVDRKACLVFGADHGIIEEGVSLMPNAVTMVMMRNFVETKGAAINVLAKQLGAQMVVVDMGIAMKNEIADLVASGAIIDKSIAQGTQNFAKGPAMSREQALASVEAGIDVVNALADEVDVFIIGEMGIGNTTPSSAIIAALCALDPEVVTGCGAGLDEEGRKHKAAVITEALALNSPDISDGLDVLSKVGGFEIGAMAGTMLGAAALKKPVMVDGLICTAAALIAQLLAPAVTDSLITAHTSVERGHMAAMDRLGKKPLLDLRLRLGEGSGAALAMPIVESGVRLMTEMSSFEDLGITL